jgi:RNA ligase (TIGR02306 family)
MMPVLIKEGRKLVTIRKINALTPIEGADMIEKATVDGWDVVVKKGEFSETNLCVFFEIDSFLPVEDPNFSFLTGSSDKIDELGTRRFRLRTKKLKGVVSQGLALPLSILNSSQIAGLAEELSLTNKDPFVQYTTTLRELEDNRNGIEEFLNVTKYERPDERNGGGGNSCKPAGNFPITIPKTDEDRVQNIFGKYSQTMKGVGFRKSLKLDGSSETIAFFSNPEFFVDKVDDEIRAWNEETQELEIVEVKPYPFQWESGQVVVCSRNLALKFDQESQFWKAALKDDIPARLKEYCERTDRQLAIQGECMGPGIQGNREELTEHTFFAFRVWDIENKEFLDDAEFQEFCAALALTTVPQNDIVYFFDEYTSIKEALESADHASIKHKIAEGDVYKSVSNVDGVTVHFKVINNKYLLKCED